MSKPNRKFNPSHLTKKMQDTGYRLKKSKRIVHMVPWIAQGAAPWRNGYARVFIPYTAIEMRNRRDSRRGHEQIVNVSSLERF